MLEMYPVQPAALYIISDKVARTPSIKSFRLFLYLCPRLISKLHTPVKDCITVPAKDLENF